MTERMPDINLKAGAIIEIVTPGAHPWFVIESPQEIREKQKAAMDAARDSMGLGEEGEIVVQVTALDVYTGEKVEVEAVDGSIHPGLIGRVKECSERYWESHLKVAEVPEAPEGAPEGMPPDVANALRGMGYDLSQISAFPLPDGSGGSFVVHDGDEAPPGPSRPMTIDQFNNGGVEVACCCGHPANAHNIGEHTVEGCTDCECSLFHTHIAAEPEG